MTSIDRGSDPSTPDGQEPRSTSVRTPAKSKKHLPLWLETVVLLAIALGLAVIIKALFLQAFYIPSESMEPGLIRNDRILVEKPSYWAGTPQRGDVVVFKDPGGWLNGIEASGPTGTIPKLMAKIGLYPSGGHLVKRVIGVAGDTIECCDDKGRISVNGKPLNEQGYVQQDQSRDCNGPMVNQCTSDWKAGPVPEGHIFVMGDNRAHSADSTVHMCKPAAETDCVPGAEFIDADLVVGKVFVLLWPRDRFDWISRPAAFDDVPDAK